MTGEDDGRGRLGRWAIRWGRLGREVCQNQGSWAAWGGKWAGEKRNAGRLWGEGGKKRERESGPGGEDWPNRVRIPFFLFQILF
jgi:hypothetical protein